MKQALLRRTESSGLDVHVECQDGVIQLSGIVDVLADRQQAEAIARDVPGVRDIRNGLTVAMDGAMTDEHIREEVNRRLARTGLGAEVDVGRVTLLGRVDNLADAREAYRIASGTRGVRCKVNHKDLPPKVRQQVERQETAEVMNPTDVEKNEHSLRDTMHRRRVETTYMQAQQHAEDSE